MDLLLGIDAGTTSVKAGLFQPDGHCLAIARQEYELSTPKASWAELDPETYWRGCVTATRDVLQRSLAEPKSVRALSVSSQGETVIALDAAGQPVYPAVVWLDNRAGREAETLAAKFSSVVYKATGIPEIIPTWTACKMLWLKQHEPAAFGRTSKFLLVQDYLIYRLTGKFATNASIACTSLFLHIVDGTWWKPVLDEIGLTPSNFPDLLPAGAVAGELSEDAALETGLRPSTKVIGGGMDQSVGAVGAGNIAAGIISETTGAALTIQATISSPHIDKDEIVPVYAHSVAGGFLFVPVCPTAGMAYKWFRNNFAAPEMEQARKEGGDAFEMLNALAAQAPPGCEGLVMLPHLMGAFSPQANPHARGSFTGFTLSHNRSHFARAILEGVAFMLKSNLESLSRAGIVISEIRSTGGGARSNLWNQIKANVTALPVVTLMNEETALLGNAILAGVAAGIFPGVAQGCARMVAIRERVMPNAEVDAYVKPYRMYIELDRALRDYYVHQYRDTAVN
jgi:sugar (pentulose or hexulose) kinase